MRPINQANTVRQSFKLITVKRVFIITLFVISLTIIGVSFFGVGHQRTLFQMSLTSMSILSSTFFLFLTIGLYHGIKLKNDMGPIYQKMRMFLPDIINYSSIHFPDTPALVAGIIDNIIAFITWTLFAIILIFIAWIFAEFISILLALFIAMLYWIFFRALRLVFKKSAVCKGHLIKSMGYGILYTALYNTWIFCIIFGMHFLQA